MQQSEGTIINPFERAPKPPSFRRRPESRVQSPAKSLSENGHEWLDKLSDESESEDMHCKESDSAVVESLSEDARYWIGVFEIAGRTLRTRG